MGVGVDLRGFCKERLKVDPFFDLRPQALLVISGQPTGNH
jgi:hypothetical protein